MIADDIGTEERDRELAYYMQECNHLGARVLRLQEEQAQAFREARRSRMVARLIRQANHLADGDVEASELGRLILEIIVENSACDRAAFLAEEPLASGRFTIVEAIGLVETPRLPITLPLVPAFHFTTAQSRVEPPAFELTAILKLPYVLWAYDRSTGYALLIGNRSESNVNRAFEAGDRELVDGALSVYLDVVARREATAKVRDAMRLAEQANQSKEAFLATLSHELRTPLNSILGLADIMAAGVQRRLTAGQYSSYAAEIGQSGRHLLRLINDILDYSSIGRGKLVMQPEWLRLAQGVGAAVRAAQGLAHQRDLTLEADEIDRTIGIFVDTVRFRQILDNLIGNAIKFTPPGGAIRVAVAPLDDSGLCIDIIDTGIGMSPADIQVALEAFGQVDNALSRRSSGTGLGLPITVGLIEAHQGRLEIVSAPGNGSTLRIILPPNRVRLGGPQLALT